ncbi:YraN family protein [Roseovarius sp. SCSIO 43702]|nr:YraN family protein [Roseovarius sp. SCSIO 43702]
MPRRTGRAPAAEALRARGLMAYLAGSAAEEQVRLEYLARGAVCLEQRWRGQAGEIDLIFRENGVVVFVEVKTSKTRDRAVESFRPAQMERVYAAGSEYLAHVPEGQLAEVRFDLATVDGVGRIEIMENAFGHF